jgi:hypothetical protein
LHLDYQHEAGGVRIELRVWSEVEERPARPTLEYLDRAPSLPGFAAVGIISAPTETTARFRYFEATGSVAPPVSWVPRFLRGDTNDDGIVDISDAVALLQTLFLGASELPCLDAADADDSGTLEITDAVHSLDWLFRGGPQAVCGWDAP